MPARPPGSEREHWLYAWQSEALEAWRANGHRGVVQAVTGAGKTRVGLAAIAEAHRSGFRSVVIVPTLVLLNQWAESIQEHLPELALAKQSGWSGTWDVLLATVQSSYKYDWLRPGEHGLLVADECHRYGSDSYSAALSDEYCWRLGLTATLEREDEGDEILDRYFQGICFELGYERASRDELISPYRFAYVSVPLTAGERAGYDELSEKLRSARRSLVTNHGIPEHPFAEFQKAVAALATSGVGQARFYLKCFSGRKKLLVETQMKGLALGAIARPVRESRGTIVFTQTQHASRLAAEVLQAKGCSAIALYSDLRAPDRELRLDMFRRGDTIAISAPRILDEGVDLPEADLGIVMASNRSRRQMIQRLGRVLRRRPAKLARFVVFYAENTVEDPFASETLPDFFTECIPWAEATGRFNLAGHGVGELLVFLGATGDAGSDDAEHALHKAASATATPPPENRHTAPAKNGQPVGPVPQSNLSTGKALIPLTRTQIARLCDMARSAHHLLSNRRLALRGKIAAACLVGDGAAHYANQSSGPKDLDLVLFYAGVGGKKRVAEQPFASYFLESTDTGRHSDQDPEDSLGRRVSVSARVVSSVSSDPTEVVRAWIAHDLGIAGGSIRPPFVLVWPKSVSGGVV